MARLNPRAPFFSFFPLSRSWCLRTNSMLSSSCSSSPKDCCLQLNEECGDFLPWLRRRAGCEISSVLSLGYSKCGRSLFASRPIEAGECILKVPYAVHMTQENMLPEVESLFIGDVGNISRLAVVLLAERKLGKASEWAPYINRLPSADKMHNTIFWDKDELEMIGQSALHQETIDKKAYIEKEFLAVRPALECFSQIFGSIKFEDFMQAFALVESRAWASSKGVSLIPFADFLNHDGTSEAVLLSDDDKETSEVIADRNYAVGEQVMIRYGKFSNATLLLEFGFTFSYNVHDQAQIWMDVPLHDPLRLTKLKLLHRHCSSIVINAGVFSSLGSFFTIKEVKSPTGKGKGIPQALRAFARVLSAKSTEEIDAMVTEAAENDGRLARRPLKNKSSEIQAHHLLLSRFQRMIEDHDAAIKMLELVNSSDLSGRFALRRQMALDLLRGVLRVLNSARAWLTYYCKNV